MFDLPPDPYRALGVSKDASETEIKKAHRKLVLTCHPDKIQDPALKAQKQDEFQRVQQAYELLMDDVQRGKYDEMVKLTELRKEFSKMSTNTSSTRTPPRSGPVHYEVRTAEPRPSTFAKSSSAHPNPSSHYKMYSAHTPPRSYEEEINMSSSRMYEEPRRAKKSSSYEREKEKDRARREEDRARRERRKEEEWQRERDLEKERERAQMRDAEKRDKERRREEKRKTEKVRQKEADENRRHKSPYVEAQPEFEPEPIYVSVPEPKPEKKKSKERKQESPSREPSDKNKYQDNIDYAFNYLKTSGSKFTTPGLTRSSTEPLHSRFGATPPAPTPPPAAAGMPPPPPDVLGGDDEAIRRSRAATRRASETPRSTKEKSSSHKKSSLKDPIVVDASPTMRATPTFSKSHSTPLSVPESPSRDAHNPHLSRAKTEDTRRAAPPVIPSMRRAETWTGTDPAKERSRSRHNAAYASEDEHYDEYPRESSRRHRYRTHSPEARAPTYSTHYTVSNGKTNAVPIVRSAVHPEEANTGHKRSHGYSSYDRPGMYSHDSYGSSSGSAKFNKVRYGPDYSGGEGNVAYSNIPHTSTYRHEAFGEAYA